MRPEKCDVSQQEAIFNEKRSTCAVRIVGGHIGPRTGHTRNIGKRRSLFMHVNVMNRENYGSSMKLMGSARAALHSAARPSFHAKPGV